MPKVNPNILPDPDRVTKTFEFDLPGTEEKLKLNLKQLGFLENISVKSMGGEIAALVNPVYINGQGRNLPQKVCELIAGLTMAQVGDPDERYSEHELAVFMAKSDDLVIHFMDTSAWVFGGDEDGPPAQAE